MKPILQHKISRVILRSLWAMLLLALPVTSFPFFPPAMGGEVLVRPLSIYPLILLLLLVVIPRSIQRPLPRILLSLLPFVLVAIASSLISLLRGIEPALGISVTARVLRGLFTLAIGCAIYLTISLLPETTDDLRFSLRWVYIGCALALFWGSLQAVYILRFDQDWFNFLSKAQEYISLRRLLPDRISGLTYEPHWFAEQIIILVLPGTLASTTTGFTAFNWRWRWLTIELVLLVWGVLILPFTYSRAGLLNLFILTLLAVLLINPLFKRTRAANQPHRENSPPSLLPGLWKSLALIPLAVLAISLPFYWIGSKNTFFARIWEYWQGEKISISGYLDYLGFGARLAYSEAAINTYQAYPFLGVGLGNYAFYLDEMLPNRPNALIPEVLRMITPEKGRDRLVTSKNFHLRLLAETGILGAITFTAFFIALLGCGLALWFYPHRDSRFWGTFSLIGLIAFILSAFTFDSFVIPNMWVIFGMITAANRVMGQAGRARSGDQTDPEPAPICVPIVHEPLTK